MTPGDRAARGAHFLDTSGVATLPPPCIDAAISARMLDALFRSERRRLLGYFRRRVGGEDAADLVQEVFARATSNARLAEVDNPVAYLQRIARNLLIDRARRRRRNPAIFVLLDEQTGGVAPPEQTWAIEAGDLLARYRQTVEAMPPKTRRVFVMSRVENCTYREISERLGITVAAVEYHMTRALVKCRTRITV